MRSMCSETRSRNRGPVMAGEPTGTVETKGRMHRVTPRMVVRVPVAERESVEHPEPRVRQSVERLRRMPGAW